jgi:hypothetical protein
MSRSLFTLVALLLSPSLLLAAVPSADLEGFRRDVAPFLERHCTECHGALGAEAGLRLDGIDPDVLQGDQLEQWRLIREQLTFGQMPPQGQPRPSEVELKKALAWMTAELRKTQLPGVIADAKLLLPAYGNYVDHEALFGEPAGPVVPVAPRTWRMRPDIYQAFVSSVTERVQGTSQPFSVLPGEGFKDYAAPYYIDEPTTDLLLRNAELVVANQTSTKYREFQALVDPEKVPDAAAVERAIRLEFRMGLRREPTDEELTRFLALYEKNVAAGGHVIGGKATLMAVLLQPEAVFRLELGEGPPDEGRVRLAPRELAVALSYAISDRVHEPTFQAAVQGKLAERKAVADQVRAMFADSRFSTSRPMDFLREYFGWRQALDVFKDPPERGTYEPGMLVSDLENTVGDILREDKDVLATLLTTNKYYVNYHYDSNKKTASPHRNGMLNQTVYGLPPDWKWTAEQPVELPADERAGVLTHPAWLVAWSGNFESHPVQRGRWIREKLLGGSVPDVPIGVDARVPEDEHATYRERLQSVSVKAECWRCHKKMNPLGLTLEQYTHYGHFRNFELGRPVDTSGAITLTGIPAIEGSVASPVELIRRLARSEHVEQVFVRHAFRFFLGRNETLGDAKTLQEAHAAYKQSGGSLKELIVSLVSSDSFLLRATEASGGGNEDDKRSESQNARENSR